MTMFIRPAVLVALALAVNGVPLTSVVIPASARDGQIVTALGSNGERVRVQVPQGARASLNAAGEGASGAGLTLRTRNRGLLIPEPTPAELGSMQVHLHHTSARAGDLHNGELAVSWATPTASNCTPVVRIDSDGIAQNGTTRSYPGALLSDGTTAASFQHVVLRGLLEGGRYHYRVYCPGYGSFNGTFLAPRRSAPAAGGAYSFAVFGDLGVSTAAHDTVRSMLDALDAVPAATSASAPGLEAVFHIGDLSYAEGNEALWNQFFGMIEPVASVVPWSVMPGNHDMRSGDSKGECGLPMLSRFETPRSRAAQPALLSMETTSRCEASFDQTEGDPYWWAVDAGYARIVTYSTDSNLTKGSAQYLWLADELEAANTPAARAERPWLLLMGHKPMYTASQYAGEYGTRGSATAGEGTEGQLTAELEDLFVAHGVDVSFYGHIHSYNRMYPVKANGTHIERPANNTGRVYRSPAAPVHMMIGMAGAGHLGAPYAQPAWSAYAEIAYGWVRATFANASALHLEFVANGDGLEGAYAPAVHDDVWITK